MLARLTRQVVAAAALLSGVAILGCAHQPKLADIARKLGTPTKQLMATTDSGVGYIDVKEGKGAAVRNGDEVTVHYIGWLTNGTKFDGSRDHGKPFVFVVGAGSVIAGWEHGVVGMRPGGVRKLVIPPDLAYGAEGRPPKIPPSAILIFEIELLKIS